ncbi:MAG: metallophosphoesterase family protein [Acidobacteria bacterium]|nr:metallophosphoesterase family protein [Acidobacteriota bacterium]
MDTIRMLALSDIHEHLQHLSALQPELQAADWVLLLGDLTQFGHRTEAARVLEAFRAENPQILAVPGNLDYPDVAAYLEEEDVSLHRCWRVIGDIGLAGLGASNRTPFGTPMELSESEIYEALAPQVRAIAAARWRIVISHAPPRDTAVDRIRSGGHVGSQSVRRIVEEFKPHLLLCGHIHEARGEDVIGHTRILNPGPFANGGFIRIEAGKDGIGAELRQI